MALTKTLNATKHSKWNRTSYLRLSLYIYKSKPSVALIDDINKNSTDEQLHILESRLRANVKI